MTERRPYYDLRDTIRQGGVPSRPLKNNNRPDAPPQQEIFTPTEIRRLEIVRAGADAGYYYQPSQDGFFIESLPKTLGRSELARQYVAIPLTAEYNAQEKTEPREITVFSTQKHHPVEQVLDFFHHIFSK